MFAVIDNPDAALLTYYGLHSMQHRGQNGAGIAVLSPMAGIMTRKGPGLVTDVFNDLSTLDDLSGRYSIGSIRYPTKNEQGAANLQPISFRMSDEEIAITYNGSLHNAEILKHDLESRGSIFHTSGAAELIVHLMRRTQGSIVERFKESLLALEGAFAFLLLHNSGVYAARDRFGIRPLSVGKLPEGGFVFASETCALGLVGATFIRDVCPGEIVYIEDGQLKSVFYCDSVMEAICLMEHVYFSRPDSEFAGKNVHSVRKRTGIELYRETHVDADIVVGVPDSSISAANGYAEASGLPNEMGLIKNRYVGRTFIQPTQAMRENGVRMKIAAIPSIVTGKRVVLIDDSIVRGTTSRHIVELLRDAGAREIHMRISSPPICFPCCYGVDTTEGDELIAHQLSLEDLRRHIKVDTLAFLSLEGMRKVLNETGTSSHYSGPCTACFNGIYPHQILKDNQSTLVQSKERTHE